ncbi:septum formation family protein [Phytoactinopolyspora mesophila]|uniref:Septum formation-related domain-containing protein n=1 Tax=Phytoactinopolyspora mesophila TaxID=2650750 RepID=A0A7K3MCG1_9ACTN|nr:septum formation family protein [Phytoactinopolyspora mesophila]NDL60662.1 hypothetical protein [Phytoactinopolyspora mesophila]
MGSIFRTAGAALLAGALVACGGDDSSEGADDQGVADEVFIEDIDLGDLDLDIDMEEVLAELEDLDFDELFAGLDEADLDELFSDFGGAADPLRTGQCWGLKESVEQDPIPCDQPHVYEVVGVFDDFDHDKSEGPLTFEELQEETAAKRELCEGAFAEYFGFSYEEQDTPTIVVDPMPTYLGQPELVVCSAHSGPGVETYMDEVVGSFADRGIR